MGPLTPLSVLIFNVPLKLMEYRAQIKCDMTVPGLAVEAKVLDHPPPLHERFISQDHELVNEVEVHFDGLDGECSKCPEVLRIVDSIGAVHEQP